MLKVTQDIVNEIREFVSRNNRPINCYVGITHDPTKRIFEDHNVNVNNINGYRFYNCFSSIVARDIEKYFTQEIGTKGNLGGGDDSAKYIYIYRITSDTKEA
jgi:hypothetical protein